MNYDDIKLAEVEIEKMHILENLMVLYLHDLSEFSEDLKVNDDGKFVYDGLEFYFRTEELKPFFIYYRDEIAGFILLNSGQYVPMAIDYSVHEFFILKSFRKKGIGSIVIKKIFDAYKGKYKIVQLKNNKPAIAFWTNLYKKQGIQYSMLEEKSDGIECMMQIFNIDLLSLS